jgi:hypothetical protein
MRKVKVVRSKGYYGVFRSLKLLIDNNLVAAVKQGEAVDIHIPEGAHELIGKMDWAKTEALKLADINDGDFILFEPYFSIKPYIFPMYCDELPMHILRK